MSRNPDREEVYDLDDLLLRSKARQRRGQTYTLDDDSEPVRPLNRPRIAQSNAVKLPPVLIGQTRGKAPSGADLWAMTQDRRVRMVTTTVREPNMDWNRDRSGMNGPRQLQKEYSAGPASRSYHNQPTHVTHGESTYDHVRQQTGYIPPPTGQRYVIADELSHQACRPSLANQSSNAESFRFSQNVQRAELNRTFADGNNRPYCEERRVTDRYDSNRHPPLVPVPPHPPAEINSRRNFSRVTDTVFPASGSNASAPSRGHEFERRYEKALQDEQRHRTEMASCTQAGFNDHGLHRGLYKPVPPSAKAFSGATSHVPAPPPGRPADQSFSKTRRRVRNRSLELDQEILAPAPVASYIPVPDKPGSPLTDFIDQFERKINEAVEWNQKVADLQANVSNMKRNSDDFSEHFEIIDSDDDQTDDDDEEEDVEVEDIDEFINELDEMLRSP